jgi:hypothetical protein
MQHSAYFSSAILFSLQHGEVITEWSWNTGGVDPNLEIGSDGEH